ISCSPARLGRLSSLSRQRPLLRPIRSPEVPVGSRMLRECSLSSAFSIYRAWRQPPPSREAWRWTVDRGVPRERVDAAPSHSSGTLLRREKTDFYTAGNLRVIMSGGLVDQTGASWNQLASWLHPGGGPARRGQLMSPKLRDRRLRRL